MPLKTQGVTSTEAPRPVSCAYVSGMLCFVSVVVTAWLAGLAGLGWVGWGWLGYLACCSSRCVFRACLNCLRLVMFLMRAGIEFHVLVFRSVMYVMGLVLDDLAGM